jgi:SAM-dependent methyltransferase
MDLRERPNEPFSRHPWELARFRFFSELLDVERSLVSARAVLDAGAGDAWFASRLADRWGHLESIVCFDTGYEHDSRERLEIHDPRIELANQRPDRRFDVVLALDVLEHIESDIDFARELVEENLRKGGFALFAVPGWPGLATFHDQELLHHRRYRPRDLQDLVRAAGLETIREGGLFPSLLLPRAAAVVRERLLPPKTNGLSPLDWRKPRWLTACVNAALRLDVLLSHGAARSPFFMPGLTLWTLCRRPS